MVNMNPKAIFPQVYIPQPMPDWDEYNEICDKFDTVLKYKGVDYRLTRDKMFTRENELRLSKEILQKYEAEAVQL